MRSISVNMILVFLALLLGGAVFAAHNYGNVKHDTEYDLYPVLLVEFEDFGFSLENPKEEFDELLNKEGYSKNGAVGSVSDYLNENFRGKRKFRFEVSPVLRMPLSLELYGAPGPAFNDCNIPQLVTDACIAAADAGFDLARYDNDLDGYVDNLSIVFAGRSEPEGGGENSIWPHQGKVPLPDARFDGVKISSYTCTPELGGTQEPQIAPIGTFCHEFAHSLGFPDLYDTNGEEEGLAPGAYGSLSIMDKGNLLCGGKIPPYFNVVERELLGIVEIEDLVPDTSYILSPVDESDVAYRIPTANPGEYFLLECRVARGWDSAIGGSGLVVYHVDKSERIYGGLSASSRWNFNNVNCYAPHECMRVISPAYPADNVGKIFFPGATGSAELVSWEGGMPLKDWGGHSLGIGIVDIAFRNGKIEFRTVPDYEFDPVLPPVLGLEALPFQNELRLDWLPYGDDMQIQDEEKWLVRWREKGDDGIWNTMEADSTVCRIKGISPDTGYDIQVSSIRGLRYGKASSIQVVTLPVSSDFPYMYVRGKGYSVGDVVDLRVLNLPGDHKSVEWFLNGVRVEGESLRIEEGGEYEIKAVISYKDGSYEYIYKNIEVK